MKFWDCDPKLKPFPGALDSQFYDGYKGPISAASAAVIANYTVVDMFASVVVRRRTPEAAAKQAARRPNATTGRPERRSRAAALAAARRRPPHCGDAKRRMSTTTADVGLQRLPSPASRTAG